MNNSLLSVIIPVHNASKFLTRCVDSILCQTYQPIEIILVNDGSKDDSGKICDLLSLKYTNIRVLHQENSGQAIARNNGVKIANGDFITFVDSDDYITDPQTYEYAIAAFTEEIDVVQYPYKTYHEDLSRDVLYTVTETAKSCDVKPDRIDGSVTLKDKNSLARCCRAANHWNAGMISTALWDKIYRKNIISQIIQRPMFLEDVVATIDVLTIIKSIKIIPSGEYAYCIRGNSTLTSQWTLKKSLDELESIMHVYDFVDKNARESEQLSITYFWIVSMMTNIHKLYGINYLQHNSGKNLFHPLRNNVGSYNLFRLFLIKVLGLKNYVNLSASIGKLIDALKR